MKIVINYNSTWRNSILNGSNDEPVTKRTFKASSKSMTPPDVKSISENTVLGVLSRLVGDQRKLYQVKKSDDFYFKDMNISFKEIEKERLVWNETVFLINKDEDRPPQSSYIGVLADNEPLFFSEYSATLWSILDLDLDDLMNFIINPTAEKVQAEVSPTHILNRVLYEILKMDNISFLEDKIKLTQDKLDKELKKDKRSEKRIQNFTNEIESLKNERNIPEVINFERKLKESTSILKKEFPDVDYVEKNGSIYPIRLYAGALYLLINELNKQKVDTSLLVSKNGAIKGFSKRSFNGVRDFLNPLMGNKKKTTHTPYDLTKADGQLEINIDVDLEKAKELKTMIEYAGVSSFYLGKKGLAYVSDIRLH